MPDFKSYLSLAGKTQSRVLAVFGISPVQCDRAVRYLRQGLPETPVWLYCTQELAPETAARCEREVVESDSLKLLVTAQKELLLARRNE